MNKEVMAEESGRNFKRVFFLGAGFSRAMDNSYPLMNDLSKNVHDSIAANKDGLGEHYRDSIAPEIKDSIETLLTYLSSDYPFKSDTRQSMNLALYKEIVKIIQNYFTDKGKVSHLAENDFNIKFSEQILDKRIDIISLNYDLVIECILSHIFEVRKYGTSPYHSYRYPVSVICNRGGAPTLGAFPYDKNDRRFRPTFLKLHGSVNWFWSGVGVSDTIYCKTPEYNTYDDIDAGLIPYIVPPVLEKNAFYNHIVLKFLWQEAHKLVEQADEIYIIGFSFPQTDLPVRFLFQSALDMNVKIPKIYIVNTGSQEDLSLNYNLVFSKYKNVDYRLCGENAFSKFVQFLTDQK